MDLNEVRQSTTLLFAAKGIFKLAKTFNKQIQLWDV